MAYMSQDRKREIEVKVKALCKRHGVKATLAVRHHSTLVCTIAEGRIDFFADRAPYRAPWGREDMQRTADEGRAREAERGHMDVHGGEAFIEGSPSQVFVAELLAALHEGNHDRSDIMTDYFDVGWYVDVNVGRWNKPYRLVGTPPATVAWKCLTCATEHATVAVPVKCPSCCSERDDRHGPHAVDPAQNPPLPAAQPDAPAPLNPGLASCGSAAVDMLPVVERLERERPRLRLVPSPETFTVPAPFPQWATAKA